MPTWGQTHCFLLGDRVAADISQPGVADNPQEGGAGSLPVRHLRFRLRRAAGWKCKG